MDLICHLAGKTELFELLKSFFLKSSKLQKCNKEIWTRGKTEKEQ